MELLHTEAALGRRRGRILKCREGSLLAVAIDDAAARQVVRRELDADAVARRDADKVAPHSTRRISDELVAGFELDLEHRVGQCLGDAGVHDARRLFLVAIVAIRLGSLRRPPRTSALTLELTQDS